MNNTVAHEDVGCIHLGIGRYYTDTGIKPVYTGIFRYRIPVFSKTQYRKIPKYRYRQKPDTEKYRNTGIKKTKYRDFGIFRNNFFFENSEKFPLDFFKKAGQLDANGETVSLATVNR